jgi:hypothetical protein
MEVEITAQSTDRLPIEDPGVESNGREKGEQGDDARWPSIELNGAS